MKGLKLRQDDVWIVSYPKSGTTWTQQIVRLIISRGENDRKLLTSAVPWVEAFESNMPGCESIDLDEMPSPRAFKSHFPYDRMPCGPPNTQSGKCIYIIRNPKDVCVSLFLHYTSIPVPEAAQLQWDDFFEVFLGGIEFGNYFEHVLSWWSHRDDDNVLVLKYEAMKKDLPSAVSKIAKFIGQDIDKKLIDEISDKTTFDNMKKDSSANCKWISEGYRDGHNPYVRKGVVGGWRDYFTPKQAERLDVLYETRLKAAGLELEFQSI